MRLLKNLKCILAGINNYKELATMRHGWILVSIIILILWEGWTCPIIVQLELLVNMKTHNTNKEWHLLLHRWVRKRKMFCKMELLRHNSYLWTWYKTQFGSRINPQVQETKSLPITKEFQLTIISTMKNLLTKTQKEDTRLPAI